MTIQQISLFETTMKRAPNSFRFMVKDLSMVEEEFNKVKVKLGESEGGEFG